MFTFLLNVILSIFCGCLYFLSFPKFDFSIFIWITFVPLFFLIFSNFFTDDKKYIKNGIFYCLIFSLTSNLGILYWIIPTFKQKDINFLISFISLILISFYFSLYFLIFYLYSHYLFNIFKKFNFIFIISLSFFWVILEYLKEYIGFPWMLLGYSQYKNINLIQLAEFGGVYIISFLIIFFNFSLSIFIFDILKLKKIKISSCLSLILSFSLIFLSLIYGDYKVNLLNNKIKKSEKYLNIVILQGSIDQYKKWDKKYVDYIKDRYSNLIKNSYKKIINNKKFFNSLIFLWIWPESSVPGFLFEENDLFVWIQDLINFTNKDFISYHIIGTVRRKNYYDFYNSAVLTEYKDKKFFIKDIYDKIKLVPFGEFVPFQKVLGNFIKVINELGGFLKGSDFKIFEIDMANNFLKFSVLICYEIIFSQFVINFSKKNINFLVNITNDGWFLNTSAPYQHFSFSVFRAVENRFYVFRAANTGISSIISPTGQVIEKTNLFDYTSIIKEINIYNEKTFYNSYGECLFFIYILIFIFLNLYFLYKYHANIQ